MPFTARVEDRIVDVNVFRQSWDALLRCPECGDPMHYRRQVDTPFRRHHFAHNPAGTEGGRTCSFSLETDAHREAKQTLLTEGARLFHRSSGRREYPFEIHGRNRRADVWFPPNGDRYPLAFEAQYSPCLFGADGSLRTIVERTKDYHAAGIHIVWAFPDTPRWQSHITEAMDLFGIVGRLTVDGSAVRFSGINALNQAEQPHKWMVSRRHLAEQRAAARAERIRQHQEAQEAQTREVLRRREEAEQRARDALLLRNEQMARQRVAEMARLDGRLNTLFPAPQPALPQQTTDAPFINDDQIESECRTLLAAGDWRGALIRASYITTPIRQRRMMERLGMYS